MLASNWDTKDARDGEGSNTAVFLSREPGPPAYFYAFTDWGASLGSWGGFFRRSRWDSAAYERQTSHFVKQGRDGELLWGFTGKHGPEIRAGITVAIPVAGAVSPQNYRGAAQGRPAGKRCQRG